MRVFGFVVGMLRSNVAIVLQTSSAAVSLNHHVLYS